jgi:hypothetical protein
MSSVPVPTPTPEERASLFDRLDRVDGEAVQIAWQAGYLARQVREKEHYASAYGARTIAVLKALLAIVRPPTTVELAAVKAATDLLDELEAR